MNGKKVLIFLIPTLCMLSLLLMPAFATPTPSLLNAAGNAKVKLTSGWIQGTAELWVFYGNRGNYVRLEVKSDSATYNFYWFIEQWKVECDTLIVCASPSGIIPLTVTTDPEPLSSTTITVYPYQASSYWTTAFGCAAFFIGQGPALTPI